MAKPPMAAGKERRGSAGSAAQRLAKASPYPNQAGR